MLESNLVYPGRAILLLHLFLFRLVVLTFELPLYSLDLFKDSFYNCESLGPRYSSNRFVFRKFHVNFTQSRGSSSSFSGPARFPCWSFLRIHPGLVYVHVPQPSQGAIHSFEQTRSIEFLDAVQTHFVMRLQLFFFLLNPYSFNHRY